MESVERFGRWHHEFPPHATVTEVQILDPVGSVDTRPVFVHQPFELTYDHHGYESISPRGDAIPTARFTPVREGVHGYRALREGVLVEEGAFLLHAQRPPRLCRDQPGATRATLPTPTAAPIAPSGPALVGARGIPCPKGWSISTPATPGHAGRTSIAAGSVCWRRTAATIAASGSPTPCSTSRPRPPASSIPAPLRAWTPIVELARQYGIRLKLCFDHFRTFEPGTSSAKVLRHPEDGRSPANIDEWLQEPTWRSFWLHKVGAYMARYAGDPTVMAWELWNEMDCVRDQRWELVREWTRDMLREVKRMAPHQLVVQLAGQLR